MGGGTRSGFLSDAILQLLSVLLLLAALWRLADHPDRGPGRGVLVFCVLVVLAPLVQLIPLPPSVWTQLPNRAVEVESMELAGRELSWMPLSIAPQATALSAIALIVPISVFLATTLLSYRA